MAEAPKLFYEEQGTGTVICLIHGFLENRKMWNPLISDLVAQHRVIAIDLPGHGNSALLPQGNSMLDMAEAIHQVLSALKVEKLSFVGHSMGGYVALAYASRYPERVARLLLLNATPAADSAARKKLRQHGIEMSQHNYKTLVNRSVSNLFVPQLRTHLKTEIDKLKAEAQRIDPKTYRVVQKSMAERKDYTDLLKRAAFKTQIVLGKEDGLINWENMQAEFSGTSVHIDVLNGGHMLHLENFSEIKRIFREFL